MDSPPTLELELSETEEQHLDPIPTPTLELAPDDHLSNLVETKCLVGRIICNKTLPQYNVKFRIKRAWGNPKGLNISDLGSNTFLFEFPADGEDANRVLQESPWLLMGHVLVLSKWNPDCTLKELDLHSSPFWVQIHGLPPSRMSMENARRIGEQIGPLLSVEPISGEKRQWLKFLRVRILLDTRKPIPRGFFLKRGELSDLWVEYKYEKLHDFCYVCGRLGHVTKDCEREDVSEEERLYGPWLKASYAKLNANNGEAAVEDQSHNLESIAREIPETSSCLSDDSGERCGNEGSDENVTNNDAESVVVKKKVYNISKKLDELTPEDVLRMEFNSDEEAGAFYYDYASVIGFSVRRASTRRGDHGELLMRSWVCSRQGERKGRCLEVERKRAPRLLTRCNCHAHLRVIYKKPSGKWIVSNFVAEHTHDVRYAHGNLLQSAEPTGEISSQPSKEIDTSQSKDMDNIPGKSSMMQAVKSVIKKTWVPIPEPETRPWLKQSQEVNSISQPSEGPSQLTIHNDQALEAEEIPCPSSCVFIPSDDGAGTETLQIPLLASSECYPVPSHIKTVSSKTANNLLLLLGSLKHVLVDHAIMVRKLKQGMCEKEAEIAKLKVCISEKDQKIEELHGHSTTLEDGTEASDLATVAQVGSKRAKYGVQ